MSTNMPNHNKAFMQAMLGISEAVKDCDQALRDDVQMRIDIATWAFTYKHTPENEPESKPE